MPDTRNAWYLRRGRLTPTLWAVESRAGQEHDDGALVDPGTPGVDGAPLLWRVEESDRGILRVALEPWVAPSAPACWFVLVPEPRASPPAVNLVAYADDRFPAGTVISNATFASARVPNDEQVAAVRWYPGTGLVHQIYVAPASRRNQVGTALLYTASAVHQAHGWQGHLHSDGRRTDIGQRFTAGLRHPGRIAPHTEVMPSMDPTD
jgi:GNAT superfamily N-acetyltransferase